jgi:hypothetical protein
MVKSIKELAWDVSEEEYRADPAISYSTLSRFEREGWRELPHLFEKQDSPSLLFGSIVDCLLTDGEEAFEERFLVAEFPDIPDSIIKIVKYLFDMYKEEYRSLQDVPDGVILTAASMFNYQSNWRPETRVKVIKEKGDQYYNLMHLSANKVIVSQDDYNDALACVRELRANIITEQYFRESTIREIEHAYQLKFKTGKATSWMLDDGVRCMFDILAVDHTNKRIYPIDLKTTGHPEENFESSFAKWRYDIQAKLYTFILADCIYRDPYFREFTIEDYLFITINRRTLSPMIWVFNHNKESGNLQDEKGNILRDWRDIYQDLVWYLMHPHIKYKREVYEEGYVMTISNLKSI